MAKKGIGKALVSSILSLVLSGGMFVGSTFAWFTDSATSGGNTIQAGTLKVDIVAEDGTSLVGDKLFFQNKNGDTDILWEPGATFRTQSFKIKNAGNLALKYRLALNGIEGNAELLDVISFSIVVADGAAVNLESFEGKLDESDALSEIYYIQGYMDEEAENNYQGKTLEGIGVTVFASQAMHEEDSFDDTYDKDATYPEPEKPQTPTFTVGTTSQLQAAMQPTVAQGDVIVNISDDMELAAGETWTPLNLDSYTGVSRIVINGNGHTIKGLNDTLIVSAIFGNTKVEINDLTLLESKVETTKDYGGAFVSYADHAISVTLNNCHLVNSTVKSANYAGGLIGFIAGIVTIEDCSVTGCTITGESVGSLVGMISVANGGDIEEMATISNVTVSGNTLTSVKVGTYRVGELLGTTNIANVILSNITATNNTCSQPGADGLASGMVSTKWIGRSSNNVTGDTSEKITSLN
jgi:predicted ribosomally synthesized peptide with SipW-like signal peptide